jgi:hypothetical protein
MRSVTGVELGPDSCALVRARPGRAGSIDVLALHTVNRSEWPSRDFLLIEALGEIRKKESLPRRARVVAWGLREGTTADDRTAVALLRPFTAAGFKVERVLTPAEALTLLAASRRRRDPTQAALWAAVNVHGAALAVIRGDELLFSRTREWSYTPALAGSRAQLLQRYSLVAQLASEIRYAMTSVQRSHGEEIASVVTCGDLPELRSLTMPLIEELDLEVETLDSTDGMTAVGRAKRQTFAESAPAIRLASIAAVSGASSSAIVVPSWARVAAAAGILLALGWGTFVVTERTTGTPPPAASETPAGPQSPSRSGAAGSPGPSAEVAGGRTSGSQSPPTGVTDGQSAVAQPSTASPRAFPPGPNRDEAAAGAGQGTLPTPISTTGQVPPPRATAPQPTDAAPNAHNRSAAAPAPSRPPSQTTPKSVKAAAGAGPSRVGLTAARRAPVDGVSTATATAKGRTARPWRAAEPLPRVDSILIDQDRRLAIVAGVVVKVGDTVGARMVLQIEADGVLLREASGGSVRVPLRAKSG